MLIYDAGVQQAAANPALGPTCQYALVRWAELLDPMTHFSRSAGSLVDPLTGLREFRYTADGFIADDGTHFGQMYECMRNLRDLIEMDRNLPVWFPHNRANLLRELGFASAGLPNTWPAHKKKAELRRRTRRLLRKGVQPLERDLAAATTGYRARLLAQVADRVHAAPASDQDWLRFDSDLAYLAAVTLAQGRDPHCLAKDTVEAFATAASAQEAVDRLAAIVNGSKERYTVALVLDGAGRVPNAAAFNCTELRGTPRWPSAGSRATHERLRKFVRRYQRQGRRACGLLVEVEAWDVGHARTEAVAVAARLEDQVTAEHRLSDVELANDALVLHHATGAASRLRPRRRTVKTARTLSPSTVAELEASLRFHGHARRERVPVLSVVNNWVALECLAEDAEVEVQHSDGTTSWKRRAATTYLPPHTAAVMGLTTARHLMTSVWQLLRGFGRASATERQRWLAVEAWLGVPPALKHVDPERWKTLLQSAPSASAPAALVAGDAQEDAAAVLHDVASALGPFAARRLAEARWRLSNGGELSNWCVNVATCSELNVVRMKLMRHRAMHRARHEDEAAQQVQQAARDTLDGVYEVVPRWLPGRSAVWEAFRDARDHYDGLIVAWNQAAGAPAVDAARLTSP